MGNRRIETDLGNVSARANHHHDHQPAEEPDSGVANGSTSLRIHHDGSARGNYKGERSDHFRPDPLHNRFPRYDL